MASQRSTHIIQLGEWQLIHQGFPLSNSQLRLECFLCESVILVLILKPQELARYPNRRAYPMRFAVDEERFEVSVYKTGNGCGGRQAIQKPL